MKIINSLRPDDGRVFFWTTDDSSLVFFEKKLIVGEKYALKGDKTLKLLQRFKLVVSLWSGDLNVPSNLSQIINTPPKFLFKFQP